MKNTKEVERGYLNLKSTVSDAPLENYNQEKQGGLTGLTTNGKFQHFQSVQKSQKVCKREATVVLAHRYVVVWRGEHMKITME